MTTNGTHDFEISVVAHALDNKPTPQSFRRLLSDIQHGKWRDLISQVRLAYSEGGKDRASAPKKKLPGALFSGTFSHRSSDKLLHHSGLICVDLDELGDQLDGYRDLIFADPHTLAAFISPTGTGLKVIFRCDPAKPHLESFRAAERYVLEHFGLQIDPACKDVNRLCFVSDDPEALVSADAEPLPYPPPPVEVAAPLPPAAALPGLTPGDDYDNRHDIQSLLLRHGWAKVGAHGWRRPGKSDGISATWDSMPEKPNRFYVFTSSTAFQSNHLYRPWHVYAILEHNGDFKAAAKKLYEDNFGDRVKAQPKSEFEGLEFADEAPAQSKKFTVTARGAFDFNLVPRSDSSVLLGNRYLNRGDIAVLSSSSGMGKSTMSIQMAIEFALNRGAFGIMSNGPLSSLIIQSEDGDGDVAEAVHSCGHVLNLSAEDKALVSSRVHIATDRINRGIKFIASLRELIAAHSPDLVWINPLQAFMDGDITDSQSIGFFLREGLNSLNSPPKFGYIIVHHTTKPATGKDRAERLWHEVMYDMAGGAEIINSARAILSLRATETEGDFNLILAKRGRRAGVTKKVPQGAGHRLEPVTTVPLRYAQGRFPGPDGDLPVLFWEPREPDVPKNKPPVSSGRTPKYDISDFKSVFPLRSTPGLELNQLHRALMVNLPIPKKSLHEALKRWADEGAVEVIRPPSGAMRYRLLL